MPGTGRVPLRPILIALGIVAASVALAAVAARLIDIVGLLVFALIITWLTRPLYRRLAQRIRSGPAIVVVALAVLGIGIALVAVLYVDLSNGATQLADRVNRSIESGGSSLFDRLVRSMRLGAGISDWLNDLPDNFLFGVNGQPMVGERMVDLSIAVVLSAFFHASASSLTGGFVRLWPRQERAQVWALLGDIDERAGDYLRWLVVIALAGSAIFAGSSAALGLPYPFLVGAWAGFWLVVPRIGWLVGLLPMVAAASTKPVWVAIVITVIAVVVCVAVTLFRKRHIETTDLRLGVGVVVTALAVGVAISGTATAVMMMAVAAIAVAVATSPHRYGMRLPMPHYDEEHAWRWGPIVIPHGMPGVVLVAVIITASVLCIAILGRSAGALVWLVLAILFAVAIDRPVSFIARKTKVRRDVAVGLVLLVIAAAVTGLVVSAVHEGPASAARAVTELPEVVRKLESAPLIGSWLKDQNAAEVVARQLEELPGRLSRSRGALDYMPQIGSQLIDLLWVGLLTVSLAFDGGRIVRAIERRVPASKRRQFSKLTAASHKALAGYAAGAVLVSAMNGTVVFILAIVLHTGLAPVLALWAFLWDFVPQIGGFIGGMPLCLLALVSGPSAFVVATVVYLVYQLTEANVIYPFVIGETIDIPAWAAMVAVLAGAAAGGLVGAIVVTPLVGVVRVLISTWNSAEFPGRAAVTPG